MTYHIDHRFVPLYLRHLPAHRRERIRRRWIVAGWCVILAAVVAWGWW